MSEASPPPRDERGRLSLPARYWVPVVICLGIMFFFSSLPDPGAVLGPAMSLGDAALHGSGFVLLALLMCRAAFFLAGRVSLRPVVWALLGCAAYGLLDEIHQIPIPGRSFEWTDWLTDVAGTAIGAGLAWGIARVIARREK